MRNFWQKKIIEDVAKSYGMSKEDGHKYIKAFWAWVGDRIEHEDIPDDMRERDFERQVRHDYRVGGASIRCVWRWYKYVNDKKLKKISDDYSLGIYLRNFERHEALGSACRKSKLFNLTTQKYKSGQLYESIEDVSWYSADGDDDYNK